VLVSSEIRLEDADPSCKECHGMLVLADDIGEQVCNVCGVVDDNPNGSASNSPDYLAAVTNLALREKPTSSMMYDLDLPTVIDSQNFDANGRRIQGSYELTQLRKWNKYTISAESKRHNALKAMREIDQIVGAVGLPNSVSREACEIYSRGLKSGIIRSRSITSMAAAAVLVACNLVGAVCPPDDIERLKRNANGHLIRQYQKLLLRNMNKSVTTSDPSRDVSRIASKAELSGKVERRSLEILAKVKDHPTLAGKRPTSLAAAALSLALVQMGERKNTLRLAFAAGVTPITIRMRSSEISNILNGGDTPDEVSSPQLIEA
jgi:transcription initiation factor TFIIB